MGVGGDRSKRLADAFIDGGAGGGPEMNRAKFCSISADTPIGLGKNSETRLVYAVGEVAAGCGRRSDPQSFGETVARGKLKMAEASALKPSGRAAYATLGPDAAPIGSSITAISRP